MTVKRLCPGSGNKPCPTGARVVRVVGQTVRCPSCAREVERGQVKRRPSRKSASEIARRRKVVADWRAEHGNLCPGVPALQIPPHQATALSADHLWEVALGGPESGELGVLCPKCQARKSSAIRRLRLQQRENNWRWNSDEN